MAARTATYFPAKPDRYAFCEGCEVNRLWCSEQPACVKQSAISAPALRYHGGKFRLASWILSFFPPHTCYVESFGGAASVLLRKPRSYAEVYNDLDDEIWNFFHVLRQPELRARLIEACQLTPYSRREFEAAFAVSEDPVERARRMAVRAAMGFGSAGATKGSTGFRIDCRRRHGTAQHVWVNYPETLAPIGERLTGVMLENRPALDVILQHDAPTTLHFVDPPYLPHTRKVGRAYRHEMTAEQHLELLTTLKGLQGMVVLCGYPSTLYAEQLDGWSQFGTQARASGGRGTVLRQESVWVNPACAAALAQHPGGLFAEAA
ncbi:MAG: DNA adenine methylase [Pseudacidovorax sp.]|nr:DNA adenine methylase [Pseudacidovorax sp.]